MPIEESYRALLRVLEWPMRGLDDSQRARQTDNTLLGNRPSGDYVLQLSRVSAAVVYFVARRD